MSSAIAFLVACASAMGFSKAPLSILNALATACQGNLECEVDGVLYAAHESGLQEAPVKAYSWDAKSHVSCGAWQTPCEARPVPILKQAKTWVALRRYSLERWGDFAWARGQ